MCRTGGASRLTASLANDDIPPSDNVDSDDSNGASSDLIHEFAVHNNHGDPLVVWHHAITAPSISPGKRSLTLADDDR